MSDDLVGRYRRVYPRIWRHPGFKALKVSEQQLALYILTGPQTNRIGVFHFSPATAAEDLNVGVDTLRKGLKTLTTAFGWIFDADARVIYIPSWWRWNRPDNLNVLRGNLKDISEIPDCALVDAFAQNLAYLPGDVHQTFTQALAIRFGKRPPTQEQYQDAVSGSGSVSKQDPAPRHANRQTLKVLEEIAEGCTKSAPTARYESIFEDVMRLGTNRRLDFSEADVHNAIGAVRQQVAV